MSGLDVVSVKVVVYEDDREVGELLVGYFHSQPYAVLIDTPDGVDRRYDGIATKESCGVSSSRSVAASGSSPTGAVEYAIVSRPVTLMPERVVTTYDTREEAEAALIWYVETYLPPNGSLFIREVPRG